MVDSSERHSNHRISKQRLIKNCQQKYNKNERAWIQQPLCEDSLPVTTFSFLGVVLLVTHLTCDWKRRTYSDLANRKAPTQVDRKTSLAGKTMHLSQRRIAWIICHKPSECSRLMPLSKLLTGTAVETSAPRKVAIIRSSLKTSRLLKLTRSKWQCTSSIVTVVPLPQVLAATPRCPSRPSTSTSTVEGQPLTGDYSPPSGTSMCHPDLLANSWKQRLRAHQETIFSSTTTHHVTYRKTPMGSEAALCVSSATAWSHSPHQGPTQVDRAKNHRSDLSEKRIWRTRARTSRVHLHLCFCVVSMARQAKTNRLHSSQI